MQLLQDTLGSVVFLGSVDGGFRPTRQDVFEFIKQCGIKTSTDPDEVSHSDGRAVRTADYSVVILIYLFLLDYYTKICLKI